MSLTRKFNTGWLVLVTVFVILLLVVASVIFLKLLDEVSIDTSRDKSTIIAKDTIKLSDKLANHLVTKFLVTNLPENQKRNVLQTINNTLQHLQARKSNQILSLLQGLDLNGAIRHLRILVRKEKQSREVAKTWVDIGNLQQLLSAEQALFSYQKASKLDRYNSDVWNRLGHYYRTQKKFTLAENAYKRVLALPINSNKAVAFAHLGLLSQIQGKSTRAEAFYLKALNINILLKDLARIATNNENLATLSRKNNNFKSAETYYLAAVGYYEKLDNNSGVANVQLALAGLYTQYKYLGNAKLHYQLALGIYEKTHNQRRIASIYSALGVLHQQQKRLKKALVFFKKSLVLHQKIKRKKGIAAQYGNLGVVYRLQKKFTKSESSHLKSLDLYQQLQYEDGLFQQQINLGFLYKSISKLEKACEHWLKGKKILVDTNRLKRILRIEHIIEQYCEAKL
jgi:tetratricopeptide (TPR) repeat protein